MCIACCIHKYKNTHSEYVILTAFPLQQWLKERASMLRYTHTGSLLLIIMKTVIHYTVLCHTLHCVVSYITLCCVIHYTVLSYITLCYPYILKHEESSSSL